MAYDVSNFLDNDTIKIDGNYAIAWSEDLRFTIEKSGKSLLGRVLLMPQV